MASGGGRGGARASPASWLALVVAGGHEEAGPRAPPRAAPGLGPGPAPAADRAAGAAIRSARTPQHTEARDAGQEARLPLLPEDIQGEAEVVRDGAAVPQQDEEMRGEVGGGANEGESCAWPDEVLLLEDVAQVVEVVSEEEAVSQRHADEGPHIIWLEDHMMEGVERHGVELLLPLADIPQVVGALSDRGDVGGCGEWALTEYGGVEGEGQGYRNGPREVLQGRDTVQVLQLLTVPGHLEGWEERAWSEGGTVQEWGQGEERMAEDKDDVEDQEEDEEDWEGQQEVPEVRDNMHVIQGETEPGQQEGWEEWALSEDGHGEEVEEEEEDEQEDSEGRQELLEVADNVQVVQLVTDPGQQEGWEQWALWEDGHLEEEEAEEVACEGQREVLEGHDDTQTIQVMTEPGHQEGREEWADTGESAADGEEESEGVHATPTAGPEEKAGVPAQVRQKAPAGRRAEAAPAPDGRRPPVEELQALQRNLEPVRELLSGTPSRRKLKRLQSWKPLLELRSTIIQRIPGFWAQVVSLMLRRRGVRSEPGAGGRRQRGRNTEKYPWEGQCPAADRGLANVTPRPRGHTRSYT